MIRPLLVAVAHSLDLLTFLMVLGVAGISGESNSLMRMAYIMGGVGMVIALKGAGTLGLASLAQMRRWALVPAAGSGILGASVNLIALKVI
jgi:hypothetical protein